LSRYSDLLKEVKEKAAAFQSTAKKYIPIMYEALTSEDPHISPQDARKRIEKDCCTVWSKRTILEALPDEAKNPEKQKAGRLSKKKHHFAAVSAAPEVAQIILDTNGRSVGEDLAANSSPTISGLSFRDDVVSTVDNKDSSNLAKYDTKTVTPSTVEFEFSLPFEEVRSYMEHVYQLNKGFGKVSFHGLLNVRTGKVISASPGSLQ
jgi:hypothetical protein